MCVCVRVYVRPPFISESFYKLICERFLGDARELLEIPSDSKNAFPTIWRSNRKPFMDS